MLSLLYYLLTVLPPPLSASLCCICLYAIFSYIYSFTAVDERYLPKFHYRNSTLARFILKECTQLSRPFVPVLWFRNAHVQSFLPLLLPGVSHQFHREYLLMKDKGVVALDWGVQHVPNLQSLNGYRKVKRHSPVLIILPSLVGDARCTAYLCIYAIQKGFRPLAFNKRGHGKSPLTTPKLQSFGDAGDLRQVVKYIRGKYPGCKISAIGISDGSGLLMSYLGEYGSSSYISVAACISPWFDIESLLHKNLPQPYDMALLYNQKRWLNTHLHALSLTSDVSDAMEASTLSEFEEKLYCKLYGYKDMSLYWERNNPMRDIDETACPLLCINSLDDPLIPEEHIPFDLFQALPNFHLVTCQYGGHCGFLEGIDLDPWAEKLAVDYVDAVLRFEDLDKTLTNGLANSHLSKSNINGKR